MDKIFDSELLSTNTFHDFDQMATVVASVWDQRYRKLGSGAEFGFAHQLNLLRAGDTSCFSASTAPNQQYMTRAGS